MNANDLRPGMIIRHNNELFTIYKAEHRTPGNLRAFVQAKMRNLRTGAMSDHRFRSEDDVERAIIDDVEMQYLYADGDSYYFMNIANYEQIHLTKEAVGDRAAFMMPDVILKVAFFEGRSLAHCELTATRVALPQAINGLALGMLLGGFRALHREAVHAICDAAVRARLRLAARPHDRF